MIVMGIRGEMNINVSIFKICFQLFNYFLGKGFLLVIVENYLVKEEKYCRENKWRKLFFFIFRQALLKV